MEYILKHPIMLKGDGNEELKKIEIVVTGIDGFKMLAHLQELCYKNFVKIMQNQIENNTVSTDSKKEIENNIVSTDDKNEIENDLKIFRTGIYPQMANATIVDIILDILKKYGKIESKPIVSWCLDTIDYEDLKNICSLILYTFFFIEMKKSISEGQTT